MKYCTKCGNKLLDEAVVCPKCGCPVTVAHTQKHNQSLQTITKVFMIIGCIVMSAFILPLAWCIPMTISYFNKTNNNQPIGIGFKICCLFFVSVIGGILMLCDDN